MERTFLMVKPDGVQRGLIGEIISRFERKGFKLVAGKLIFISESQAKAHYVHHEDKPFFESLIAFITSGPAFAMVWEGDNIIELSRMIIGKTNVTEALPGTIRGDYAAHTPLNLIHGSDSLESAGQEIFNFFEKSELLDYAKSIATWV